MQPPPSLILAPENRAMESPNRQKRVMIIAGEASGDAHASRLVSAMRSLEPGLVFYGIGGPLMEAAGVRVLYPSSRLSVVGLIEVAEHLGDISEAFFLVREVLSLARPDLLICVDFPDFNFLAAKAAKKKGIKVLYYISPQVWAWRTGRVKKIRSLVDHMAVILPFEKEFYEKSGVSVTFVGHPLLDQEDRIPVNAPSGGLLVALAPGSRRGEVLRHLPSMLEAAAIIKEKRPEARFAVPCAPGLEPSFIEAVIGDFSAGNASAPEIEVWPGGMEKVFREAAAAIMVSGTVTLEAALAGLPHIIIYRLSPVTYMLGRLLIKVPHIGLANLIAGKEVAGELIQNEASPAKMAQSILKIVESPESLEKAKAGLARVRGRLGGPGACEKTAKIALSLL